MDTLTQRKAAAFDAITGPRLQLIRNDAGWSSGQYRVIDLAADINSHGRLAACGDDALAAIEEAMRVTSQK